MSKEEGSNPEGPSIRLALAAVMAHALVSAGKLEGAGIAIIATISLGLADELLRQEEQLS